jgi:hypothetical protein
MALNYNILNQFQPRQQVQPVSPLEVQRNALAIQEAQRTGVENEAARNALAAYYSGASLPDVAQIDPMTAMGVQKMIGADPAAIKEHKFIQGLSATEKQQFKENQLIGRGLTKTDGGDHWAFVDALGRTQATLPKGLDPEKEPKYIQEVEDIKAGVAVEKAKKIAEVKGFEVLAKAQSEAIVDLSDLEAMEPQLQDVVERLKDLSPLATYTMAGRGFDVLAKELGFGSTQGANARTKYIAIIDNQILPLLRPTFGAAFTEREGDKLKKTLGDENATPSQKREALDAFWDQIQMNLKTKRSKAESLGQEVQQRTQEGSSQTPAIQNQSNPPGSINRFERDPATGKLKRVN